MGIRVLDRLDHTSWKALEEAGAAVHANEALPDGRVASAHRDPLTSRVLLAGVPPVYGVPMGAENQFV